MNHGTVFPYPCRRSPSFDLYFCLLTSPNTQAAVDVETDALLQTTLRGTAFQNRTIITIAHRINTILDSDKIVVLQQGRVAEFDAPSELIKKKGLFYELVREAGLLESAASAAGTGTGTRANGNGNARGE